MNDAATAAIDGLVEHFHRLIVARLQDGRLKPPGVLPDAAAILRSRHETGWLPIPGMYGGFAYRLVGPDRSTPKLQVRSWSRVVSGSEQEHEVTPSGYTLVAEGSE